MDPRTYLTTAVTPALRILPSKMTSDEANAMLVAIAGQESGLRSRRQLADGPARGLLQSETEATFEVLQHPASLQEARIFLRTLEYTGYDAMEIHLAREFDLVLDAGLARLALWRDPDPLPKRDQMQAAWAYYLHLWAPGMPRPNDWAANWARAWAALG